MKGDYEVEIARFGDRYVFNGKVVDDPHWAVQEAIRDLGLQLIVVRADTMLYCGDCADSVMDGVA